MYKWLMTSIVAGAVAFGALTVERAQGQHAPAMQPANNADEALAAEDLQGKLAAELALAAQVQEGQQGGVVAAGPMKLRTRTEKAAWLGVNTSQVPQALRQHLKMQNKYVGLVIERVEPESPAAEAGLEQFDIIEKINDQWIVNTQQFSVVLRMQKPGDQVTISVIREGQPQQVQAKLAEKELPVLSFTGIAQLEMMPGVPDAPDVFRLAPQGNIQFFREGHKFDHLMNLEKLNELQDANMVVTDPHHTLKVTKKKGDRYLVASDSNGVVIFEGPINTEEELAAVPDEIRDKVEDLDTVPTVLKATAAPATNPAREDK